MRPSTGKRLLIHALTLLGYMAAATIIVLDSGIPMGLRVVGFVIAVVVLGVLSRAAFNRLERAQPGEPSGGETLSR